MVLLALVFAALGAFAQEGAAPTPSEAKITHGPLIESTTSNSAVIAWTTNVSAGTLVRYGQDAGHLDKTAGMPWGGYTHRATLHNLQPDTTYFYQATSPQAQGSGEDIASSVGQFRTPGSPSAGR
jgi:phosphodiesterase/alkaline phosphatase D-like protein